LVQIFKEVKRVLRKDGTLWLNLGDSYASGKGSCYNPGGGERSLGKHLKIAGVHYLKRSNISDLRKEGLKPKDLCEIPSEVVRALRDDGWWLRSRIPWIKRNSMPESVKDRPTTVVEYIFLLTKSSDCFYDAESIKIRASDDTHARYARGRSRNHKYSDGGPGNQTIAKSFDHMIGMPDNYRGSIPGRRDGPGQDRRSKKDRLPGVHPKSTEPGTGNRANSSFNAAVKDVVGSRNRRNSDWFFESWQGLLSNEEGDPLAMVVNSSAFSGSHFSTFPERIVEPCIKAGTSLKGCCPACGAPWTRIIEKSGGRDWKDDQMKEKGIPGELFGGGAHKWGQSMNPLNDVKKIRTIGWQPTCSCDAGDPVPCMVLDPFHGSGTVGAVAERLNRRWVGLDLGYQDLQRERLVGIQKEMPLIG
jgi:DNA modification methylase